jgi:hypothetical protein
LEQEKRAFFTEVAAMSQVCIRCQVLETPAEDGRRWGGRDWPRDLLPWADPYIATLMAKLERRYGADDFEDEGLQPAEMPALAYAGEDAWGSDDAFMPPHRVRDQEANFPPVFGGWPLLDA